MRIVEVEALEIELSGADGITSWHPVFARVTAEDGTVGLGELGMAYGTGAPAGPPMILALAERFLLGRDAMATGTIWADMLRKSFWAEGGGPVVFGAMSALDAALWDIKGRLLGQPVHRLLGAETPAPLRCYASQLQFDWSETAVNLTDPAAYRDAAARAREQGYDCVKVDPVMVAPDGARAEDLRGFFPPDKRRLARQRMEAIRDGAGPDTDIILELHSFTSREGALQLAELVADLGILLIEEPTHYNAPSPHLALRHRASRPLAAGERLYTRWGFQPYFEAQAIDMAQPDLGLAGGITEGMRIADLAEMHDITVQAHVCGSPLATAIALQFEAAIANFEIHEHHSYALKACNRDLFEEDLQPQDGVFEVPTRPGFGMTLSAQAETRMNKAKVKART